MNDPKEEKITNIAGTPEENLIAIALMMMDIMTKYIDKPMDDADTVIIDMLLKYLLTGKHTKLSEEIAKKGIKHVHEAMDSCRRDKII